MENMRLPLRMMRRLWRDERGITGLETSIMLIAFVVVASVFAFAVLRMGVFSADRTGEAVTKGMGEITSVLSLRGSVVAHKGVEIRTTSYVKTLSITVRPNSNSELTDETTINYEKDGVCTRIPHVNDSSQPGLNWDVEWTLGSGPVLDALEEAKITLTLYGLRDKLETDGKFSIAIKPEGAPSEPCIPRQGSAESLLLSGNVTLDGISAGELDAKPIPIKPGLYEYGGAAQGAKGITFDNPIPSPTDGYVGHLTFLVNSPSGTIDLSGESTDVSYYDSSGQAYDLPFLDIAGAESEFGLGWGMLGGSGPELGPGERADIQVNLSGMEELLGAGTEFTVEIRPAVGQPLIIEKTLPSELDARNVLD